LVERKISIKKSSINLSILSILSIMSNPFVFGVPVEGANFTDPGTLEGEIQNTKKTVECGLTFWGYLVLYI